MTLSDFDLMRHVRLPNWARWSWHDIGCPNPDDVVSSIYSRGKQDESDRDPDAAPEPPSPPIDEPDALWVDMLILERLPTEHIKTIRFHYYKRRPIDRERVDAAVRALLDAEDVALERIA